MGFNYRHEGKQEVNKNVLLANLILGSFGFSSLKESLLPTRDDIVYILSKCLPPLKYQNQFNFDNAIKSGNGKIIISKFLSYLSGVAGNKAMLPYTFKTLGMMTTIHEARKNLADIMAWQRRQTTPEFAMNLTIKSQKNLFKLRADLTVQLITDVADALKEGVVPNKSIYMGTMLNNEVEEASCQAL